MPQLGGMSVLLLDGKPALMFALTIAASGEAPPGFSSDIAAEALTGVLGLRKTAIRQSRVEGGSLPSFQNLRRVLA